MLNVQIDNFIELSCVENTIQNECAVQRVLCFCVYLLYVIGAANINNLEIDIYND